MPDEETPAASAKSADPGGGLGRAIRLLRTARDLGRRALAERAGLSYSYLSEIETGKKVPSAKSLGAIAGALGLPPHELLATADKWSLGVGDGRARAAEAREWARADSVEADDAVLRVSETVFAAESAAAFAEPSSRDTAIGRRSRSAASPAASELSFSMVPPAAISLPVRAEPDRIGSQASDIPPALLEEIETGNCIAFVGAGFSAAGNFPTWGALLETMAHEAPDAAATFERVSQHVAHGSAHALGEAAQLLEDHLGRARFVALLRSLLTHAPGSEALRQRVSWLHGIPFRAILTTNFDDSLAGAIPGHTAYRRALRADGDRWWNPRYWSPDEGAFTVKLHGDLADAASATPDSVILTRRAYRRRLYEDPGYETFLRAVMATNTVLYHGFSFEDAYLNELRSEILSLLGQRRDSTPVAYAIVNDVPEESRLHFRHHEGIELLSYDTDGGRDFSGFDAYLRDIHAATNPLLRFAGYLENKRILWLDPHPENNELAFEHLARAASVAGREASALVTVPSVEQAVRELRQAAKSEPYDVVITHFGAGTGRSKRKHQATAVSLLTEIRARDIRCPVIVFAAAHEIEQRKRTLLGLGAQTYCYTFGALYQALERVLGPGNDG